MDEEYGRLNISPEVARAIRDSVEENGQGDKVARLLLAWISQLSIGQTGLSNSGESHQYFAKLQDVLDLRTEDLDDEA